MENEEIEQTKNLPIFKYNFDEFIVLSEDDKPIDATEFDATEERNKIYFI